MYRTLYSPQGAHINLDGRDIINMASNNYLGLANDPDLVAAAKEAIDKYGVGPSASRNIVGNFAIHDELEEALAKFKGVEAVLVFNSGVAANTGVIPILVGKGDTIYSDELNHGSIIDGCRLSRANVKVYPPLPEMAALAEKYGAMFMVDDAHGDGVMGPYGKGTVEHFGLRDKVTVETGSLSKAFGAAGGFVAGTKEFIEELRPKARSFIFTASPLAPCLTAAALAAINKIADDDTLVKRLWENREYFAKRMEEAGLNTGSTVTPVIPVIVGDAEKAEELSARLYEKGVYAQAIKFPVVPRGTARLRVMISAAHTREDLEKAADAIIEITKEMGII